MKETGLSWVPYIPDSWNVVRIKDIARLQSGEGITSDSIDSIGDFPVFGGNGLRGYTDSYTNEGDYVLIGRQGALCGNINYASGKFFASEHAVVVYPHDRKENTTWLGETLRAANLNRLSASAAQPGLAVSVLNFQFIPYPPKEVRKKIGNYLDEKLAKINKRLTVLEKQQDAYVRLKKSIIHHAVTRGLNPNVSLKDSGIEWIGMIPEHWEGRRLKDFSVLNPQYTGQEKRTEVSFLPMEGLRYDSTTLQSIPFEEGKGKYTFFADGDLLMAKVTPCFENGNIAIAENLKGGIGFGSSEIFVLRLDRSVSSRFFFYYVQAPSFQDEACSTMCGVGGLKRISPIFMRARLVFLPHLSEQQAIANHLDDKCAKIDYAIENIGKQIDASKRLKRALINEVITGQRAV